VFFSVSPASLCVVSFDSTVSRVAWRTRGPGSGGTRPASGPRRSSLGPRTRCRTCDHRSRTRGHKFRCTAEGWLCRFPCPVYPEPITTHGEVRVCERKHVYWLGALRPKVGVPRRTCPMAGRRTRLGGRPRSGHLCDRCAREGLDCRHRRPGLPGPGPPPRRTAAGWWCLALYSRLSL
jgi:hypothetical protein